MLLNIPQRPGQPPKTKKYLARNANSAKVKEPCGKVVAVGRRKGDEFDRYLKVKPEDNEEKGDVKNNVMGFGKTC